MKKYSIFIFLILTVQWVIAQNSLTIYGTITNPKGDKIFLRMANNHLSYDNSYADSAQLDEKGNFSMTLPWKEAAPSYIYDGNEITSVFLYPGDSLRLTLDTKAFDETVKYEGRGSFINNYLAKKCLFEESFANISYLTKPEEEFRHLSDSILKLKTDFLKSYFSEENIKANNERNKDFQIFKDYEEVQMKYLWAHERYLYPSYYTYVHRLDTPLSVSQNYNDYQNLCPIDNPKAIKSGAYLSYVDNYIDGLVKEMLAADSTLNRMDTKEQYILENFSGELKDYLYSKLAYYSIVHYNDLKKGKQQVQKYKSFSQNELYIQILEEYLQKASRLTAGNPAPDFSLPDTEGNMVSLKDFKGKVVYLDIWASWCGPCIREIPAARELEEEMQGQDVVFLCVSVDDDENAWRQSIEQREMTGLHLIAKGNFQSDVAKLYNVRGIPHYVIIDQEGRIVVNHAKRPSHGVKADLEKLLE